MTAPLVGAWTEITGAMLSTNPDAAVLKLSLSCASDHEKPPLIAGVVRKADCTLFVSIGSLNCRTIGREVATLAASCAGVLLTTSGSGGRQSGWATKIFAVIPGTEIRGVSGVAVTVRTSFVSSTFAICAPGAKVVERLVRV